MSDSIEIKLTRDEALVLFEFFSRFDDTDEFVLRHNSEYVAFSKLSAQLDRALVEPFKPDYKTLLEAARARLAEGHEGNAPGVVN